MFNRFLFREEWILAIRKRKGNLLFQEGGKIGDFNIIPNNWRYWCADPFLINYDGREFVFFEMYDRWKGRGVVGYREIFDENHFSEMKVAFDCHHHLSYPNIYSSNGEIYFVPESYVCNKVSVYRAVEFPDKWEECMILIDDIVACDTTFIDDENLLTMANNQENTGSNLLLFKLKDGVWKAAANNPVETDPSYARCAGKIFRYNNFYIRPAQDGVGGYGMGIYFREIEEFTEECYRERTLTKITVADVSHTGERKYDGIHTYNFDDEYEIIDLKIARAFHFISIISCIFGKAYRLCKKLKK